MNRRLTSKRLGAVSRVGIWSVSLAIVIVVAQTLGIAANAAPGYTASLTSPTVPDASDTYTWTIDGDKAGPGLEISHLELSGCWGADDVADVSSSAGTATVQGDGTIKVEPLSDDDLPLTVTVEFEQSYASQSTGTTVFVKTGGGQDAGETIDVGGPVCEAPPTTPPPTTPPPTTPPPTTPPPTTPPPTTPPPAGELSVGLIKTNDADDDGTYSNAEEATAPDSDVSFQVVVTNTGEQDVTITSLTDVFPGATIDLLNAKCSALDGLSLAPDESVSCTFVVRNYSPPSSAGAKINTVEVCVQGDSGEACDSDNSRVTSAEVLGSTVTPPGPSTTTPPLGTAFTGSRALPLGGAALVLLLIGSALLYVGRRREDGARA